MEVECETSLLLKTAEARQHFFHVRDAPGFIGYVNEWQVFFEKVCRKPRITRIKRMNSEIGRQTSGSEFFFR